MKRILIVGATGPIGLGREICKILSKSGTQYELNVLVRKSAKNNSEKRQYLNELKACNAQFCEADLKDPDSLLRICEGMDVVMTSATVTSSRQTGDTPETVDMQGQQDLLVAAEKVGVKKYIYVSYSDNNQVNADCVLTDAKKEMEVALRASLLDYTILKPTYFSECWLSPRFGFDIENRIASLCNDGQARISWVSIKNVAQFAVSSISHPNARRASLNIGGPEALSVMDIVKYCEQRLECQFELKNVSERALEQALEEAKAGGNSLEQSLAALTLGFTKDDVIDMGVVSNQFPEIKMTSVKDIIDQKISLMEESVVCLQRA
ncbi:MAG TPA: NAD-dependent epimerase/dehydratase family protein [Gammaproteobacteria bacterium]|nr:NAD-dependent epimerase/dehydratase family protein [Gammaproteobacteria bacterium]